jgi:hypothetical protein
VSLRLETVYTDYCPSTSLERGEGVCIGMWIETQAPREGRGYCNSSIDAL